MDRRGHGSLSRALADRQRGPAKGCCNPRSDRFPSAAHSRCAASKSKSASSGNSMTSGAPLAGSSRSQRRCVAPPSRIIACQPSKACLRWASDSLLRSRSYGRPTTAELASPILSMAGSASGAQKMVCSLKAWCGSAAKRKPPSQSKLPALG